jgi:dihydropyrimidinase
MSEFDTVIRGGTVVTASDTFDADVGIAEGRIAAIARALPDGRRTIDARGKLVMPGGVDGHCHLDQPSGDGSVCADDFHTGTVAAAFGGTTTVIPFACQFKGMPMQAAVDDYHRRATGKAVVDYAFHLIVSDPTPTLLEQDLPRLIGEGYTSFKVYMTYDDLKLDDRQIIRLLSVARRHGAMTMIHAENADLIAWLTDGLLEQGKIEPRYHAQSRPMVVEREATHRAISIAELADVPILIVHVSGREAVEQIHWAQGRGLRIYAETCPQYVTLTEDHLAQPGFEGAKCICSPPPRDVANQSVIWDGLENGLFHVFSSDHAPFRYKSPTGKMLKGENTPFKWVPNGVPGIETRLPILFSEGVRKGRISLNRFVDLVSTQPARMYGLHPRKGSLSIGADADVVVFDPELRRVIRADKLHQNVDYTPYEGMVVDGWPVLVMSRGDVIVEDMQLHAAPGRGAFLRCGKPDPARPKPPRVTEAPVRLG